MLILKSLLSETTLHTKQGSIIRRYKNNVGKQIGNRIYVHKLYADEIIPKSIWNKALDILTKSYPDFSFNTIMFDPTSKIVRFDEAPDFDSASEPKVGDFIEINVINSSIRTGHSDNIWHHKWLWVKDDYTGFDVDKSKEWSRIWISKLKEPAKGTKIHWDSQLRNIGLLNEGIVPELILGAIWPDLEIKAIKGNENSRHPMQWSACKKWRYIPELQYLTWWESPTEKEMDAVFDWLDRKNFRVEQSSLLTIREVYGDPGDHVVFGSVRYPDYVIANIYKRKDDYFGHTRDMAYDRWVYYQGTGIVFWHHFPPSSKEKMEAVDNWLNKRGYKVKSHKDMKKYYESVKNTLNEGVRLDAINKKISELESEWERLDSVGTGHSRQMRIRMELEKLWREKEKWEKIYSAIYPDEYSIKEVMINEALTKEEAALSFLKKMVQSGPFKGKVYLAGGAVRDMVLGKKPKDLDVVVIGNGLRGGLDFAIWLAKQMGNYKGPEIYPPQFNFSSHIQVDDYGAPSFTSKGEPENIDPEFVKAVDAYTKYYASFSNPLLFPKFGTAKINLTGTYEGVSLDGIDVEAVASRREEYTQGNRKPRVFPGTLKDDVFRRDFTANSLVMDLTSGEVLDLTGKGKADIAAGILRTTSDPSIIFKEDPLRMMRAVRFMAQKGWKIDPETEDNIKKNASWLRYISHERIRDELNKILVVSDPTIALTKMRDLGLLPYISPELQTAVGMTQNIHHKHDVFDHTIEVLKNTKPELVQRLMALFHDIGKIATRSETPTGVHFYGHEDAGADMVDSILSNLKYPTEIINAVKIGVKNHMRLKQGGDDAVKLSDKALRKFKIELGDNLETILDLIHADNIAHADASAMPNQIAKVRERLKSLDVQVKKPSLPINGNDLISMGVPQGPMIGKILSAITDAWFENPNITRENAIEIVKRMI